jgi:hypothetical protein
MRGLRRVIWRRGGFRRRKSRSKGADLIFRKMWSFGMIFGPRSLVLGHRKKHGKCCLRHGRDNLCYLLWRSAVRREGRHFVGSLRRDYPDSCGSHVVDNRRQILRSTFTSNTALLSTVRRVRRGFAECLKLARAMTSQVKKASPVVSKCGFKGGQRSTWLQFLDKIFGNIAAPVVSMLRMFGWATHESVQD